MAKVIEEETDRREVNDRRCGLGDVLEMPPLQSFGSKDDLKKSFWKNIHFGRVVVWCGVNQMIVFSEASILQSIRSSILPFKSSWC